MLLENNLSLPSVYLYCLLFGGIHNLTVRYFRTIITPLKVGYSLILTTVIHVVTLATTSTRLCACATIWSLPSVHSIPVVLGNVYSHSYRLLIRFG